MKSVKSLKKRRRSSSEDRRPRRYRDPCNSWEPAKSRKTSKRMRRVSSDRSSPETKPSPPPLPKNKKPEVAVEETKRVSDLLHDPQQLIDHLFRSVPTDAIREITPDTLKSRSTEELKRLCLLQLQDMSEVCILRIISGKESSFVRNADEETTNQGSSSGEYPTETGFSMPSGPLKSLAGRLSTRCSNVPSPAHSDSVSSDALELYPSTREMESLIGEENLVPVSVREGILHDLAPANAEADLELLEMEMRARAIRSLLQSKTQSSDP